MRLTSKMHSYMKTRALVFALSYHSLVPFWILGTLDQSNNEVAFFAKSSFDNLLLAVTQSVKFSERIPLSRSQEVSNLVHDV